MSLMTILAFSIAVLADSEDFSADLPQGDPVVPPALRQAPREKGASGDELRQQVIQKLKARFDAADTNHDARLTADEAKTAGLGFVAAHFADIDTAKRGSVSFDDLKKYLQSRRQGG
jgi:hypothetical protein